MPRACRRPAGRSPDGSPAPGRSRPARPPRPRTGPWPWPIGPRPPRPRSRPSHGRRSGPATTRRPDVATIEARAAGIRAELEKVQPELTGMRYGPGPDGTPRRPRGDPRRRAVAVPGHPDVPGRHGQAAVPAVGHRRPVTTPVNSPDVIVTPAGPAGRAHGGRRDRGWRRSRGASSATLLVGHDLRRLGPRVESWAVPGDRGARPRAPGTVGTTTTRAAGPVRSWAATTIDLATGRATRRT